MITEFLFKPHLEEGEKIAYIAHRHIFTEGKRFFKTVLIYCGSAAVFWILIPVPPFQYIWIAWMSLGVLKILYQFLDWYYDAWLVTDLSVIDVEWKGFFDRTSTRAEYNSIRGITYNIKGFWGTVLKFGDIELEHFLANNIMKLPKASRPKKIERAILNAQKHFIENKTMTDHEVLKQMLSEMIVREHARRKKASSN